MWMINYVCENDNAAMRLMHDAFIAAPEEHGVAMWVLHGNINERMNLSMMPLLVATSLGCQTLSFPCWPRKGNHHKIQIPKKKKNTDQMEHRLWRHHFAHVDNQIDRIS